MARNIYRLEDGREVGKDEFDRHVAELNRAKQAKEAERTSRMEELRAAVSSIPDDPMTAEDWSMLTGQIAGAAQGAADEALSQVESSDLGGPAAQFLSGLARSRASVQTATGIGGLRMERSRITAENARQRASLLLGVEGLAEQSRQADMTNALAKAQMAQSGAQFNAQLGFAAKQHGDRTGLDRLQALQNMNPLNFPGGPAAYQNAVNQALGGAGLPTRPTTNNSSSATWARAHSTWRG